MKFISPAIVVLMFTGTLATTAFAERLPIDSNARLKIGANASFNSYGYNMDSDITVMPHAFYDNNRLYIEGNEAGAYVYKDAKNEWRATVGYDSRSFDPKNAPAPLKALEERQWSAMVGTSYMRVTPYGGFKAQVETDALNRSDGTAIKLSHLSKFTHNKWTVYPEVGVQWFDDKYNNYYYGVSQKESLKSGVPAYKADAGVSPFALVSASYAFSPKWSGFISQSAEWLSSEQKDSPMVDNGTTLKTKVGFNYQF